MKVLVTGGAGFIGSHLVDKLVANGYTVIVIDNLRTGKKENINSHAKLYEVDLLDKLALENVLEKERPEYVFHLAAQPYVSVSTKNPQEDAQINIIGGINLLEVCKKHKPKIIYSNSGGATYGTVFYLPFDESHPLNPLSQYGISKHTIEHYLHLYHHLYGLNYTSLRYANIYGPRQDPYGEGGVIAIFASQLLQNKQPTIFGDGTQVRDYCYVSDVVNANIWAMNHGNQDKYNVGTGKGTTTQEIFDIIKKETSSQLEPIYVAERAGDVKACVLNSNKLQAAGWALGYTLEKGIHETVNYFRSTLK